MKQTTIRLLLFTVLFSAWVGFGSWTGGPYPDCKSDSLAIVRVVKPVNSMFNIKPAIFVSKGYCKIEEVKMTEKPFANGELAVTQTLSGLLMNGYILQTTTESFEDGVKLNTYYLKKKTT